MTVSDITWTVRKVTSAESGFRGLLLAGNRGCVSTIRRERRFEGSAPARPEELAPLRTAVWRHAQAVGAAPEVANDIRLAVGEALMNVVMHAYLGMEPGAMILEAWLDDDDHLTVQVLDDGLGLVPRVDSPGLGVGLGVMAQVADDFRIANREGRPGTIVSLRFSLGPSR